jgi:hypothetical protein
VSPGKRPAAGSTRPTRLGTDHGRESLAAQQLRADHRRGRRAITKGLRRRCKICSIDLNGPAAYKDHLEGRRHKARLQVISDGHQQCDDCCRAFLNKAQLEQHLLGKAHRSRQLVLRKRAIRVAEEEAEQVEAALRARNARIREVRDSDSE